MSPLWSLRPRLAIKLQRPYVSSEFGAAERCAALLGHYHHLPFLLTPETLAAIYGEGHTLLQITLPESERRLDLRLCYKNEFEMEGELTLCVMDYASGLMVAGLTFCLSFNAGASVCIIGGIQATRDPRMRDLIHDIAKEMHGLRPKAFAVWGLQQILSQWGIESLQAVCDAQHIYRHWRKRKEIPASYDEFWAECDGRRLSGGGWELPIQGRIRTREELKPSRRKQHERRYLMLAETQQQLHIALSLVAPTNQEAMGLCSSPRCLVIPRQKSGSGAKDDSSTNQSLIEGAANLANHSF